ncbi:hypothetical protein RB597_008786 [Gaeumannomyces tritici]
MAPLSAIVPFSPFSPSGEWQCCACGGRHYMHRTRCVRRCNHWACGACIIFDRRGERVPPLSSGRRIPVNWACANAAHRGGTEALHSVAELLTLADGDDGDEGGVRCWCGDPAFDPAAVYDHWGNLMGDDVVAAEAGVLDFDVVLDDQPRTVFALADDDGGREAAAAFLRHHPDVGTWGPVLQELAANRAVKAAAAAAAAVAAEAAAAAAVAAAAAAAAAVDAEARAGSRSPGPADARLPTPPPDEGRLAARVTRRRTNPRSSPAPGEEGSSAAKAAKGKTTAATRKRRRDGDDDVPALAGRITRAKVEKPKKRARSKGQKAKA